MKKSILLLFLAIPLALSAQNFTWTFSSKIPVAHTDTIIWADKFRDAPFSLDIDYTGLNHAIKFAVVVSNWTNGAYSFYPFEGVSFPVTLDPVADAYTDANGVSHASDSYKGKDIPYARFGILITKIQATTGKVNGRLKQ